MPILINYPLFHADDDAGAPLTGGLLYSYIAGSSTNKATYTTRAMSTANANPVVLNSRGEAVIYGSGLYKLILKTAEGVTIWTQDNVELGPGQGAYSFFVDPSEVDHGIAGTGASLYDILTALGTSKKATIYFPHSGVGNTTTYTVSTTYDASAYTNVTFEFENGAILAVATGKTLTLPSPASIVASPNQQIFSGAGTVSFSAPSEGCNPRHFGAKGDGVTDDTTAFSAAINSSSAKYIYIPNGSYLITDSLAKFYVVKGEDKWNTKIYFKPTGASKILFDASPADITINAMYGAAIISDVTIYGGNAVDKTAIRLWHVSLGYLNEVQVLMGSGAGDTSTGSIALNIMGNSENTISNCYFDAARPILAEAQPTSARNSLDHITFENITLYNLIGSHPLVEFQIISNQTKFTGRQTWVGGTSAFYSTGLDHGNLSFDNIRWEDGAVTQTQHTFYIVGASTGTTPPDYSTLIAIRDSRIGMNDPYNGIYARYVYMLLLENVTGSMGTPAVTSLYDVDGTNAFVTVINTSTYIGPVNTTIGADLKLVFSIGGALGDDGVAFTRFYTSTKAFAGGIVGKPYVGLMDSLYWTYRGSVAGAAGAVYITGEAITEIQFARIEIHAYDPTTVAGVIKWGDVVYTVLNDGTNPQIVTHLSALDSGTAEVTTNIFVAENDSVIYVQNNNANAYTCFIKVFYWPLVARK